MEYEIKPATLDNLTPIQELNLLLFKKEFREFDSTLDTKWTFSKIGEDYYRDHITRDDNCAFVALMDGEVVGYLAGCIGTMSSYRTPVRSAELENMFVRDTHRDMGIGSSLYETFVHWCQSKGVTRLSVVASAQNRDAIDFYRKNNFIDYSLTLEANI